MSVTQAIKQSLLSDRFDPFDLTQLGPPAKFRSGDFNVDHNAEFDPYEGFCDSMEILGDSLKRGIEIYVEKQ